MDGLIKKITLVTFALSASLFANQAVFDDITTTSQSNETETIGNITFLKEEPDGYFSWSAANQWCEDHTYRLATMSELIETWNASGQIASPIGFQKDTFYWASDIQDATSHKACAMDYDCSSEGSWPDNSNGHPKCVVSVENDDTTDIVNDEIEDSGSYNTPPTVTSLPVTTAQTNTAYSYTPTANDVENDTLIWSISGGTMLPSWLDFTNGNLTGTPTKTGGYSISLTLSDGKNIITHAFSIVVSSVVHEEVVVHEIIVNDINTSATADESLDATVTQDGTTLTTTATINTTTSKVVTTQDGKSKHYLEVEGKDATEFSSEIIGMKSYIDTTGKIDSTVINEEITYSVIANPDGSASYTVTKDSEALATLSESAFAGAKTTLSSIGVLRTVFNYNNLSGTQISNNILTFDVATNGYTTFTALLANETSSANVIFEKDESQTQVKSDNVTITYQSVSGEIKSVTDTLTTGTIGTTTVTVAEEEVFDVNPKEILSIKDIDDSLYIIKTVEFGSKQGVDYE